MSLISVPETPASLSSCPSPFLILIFIVQATRFCWFLGTKDKSWKSCTLSLLLQVIPDVGQQCSLHTFLEIV